MQIVHIDDDEDFLKLFEFYIRKNLPDVEIKSFTRLQELMDFIKNNGGLVCDLVITDYELQETSGIEVVKKLKEHCDDCVFILISGSRKMETLKKAYEIGMDFFYHKLTPVKYLVHQICRICAMVKENKILRRRLEGLQKQFAS